MSMDENNATAPYAPFSGMVTAAPWVDEVKLSVAVSRTPAACVDVNCTPIWQVVGAVSVARHVLPEIVKSPAKDPPAMEKLPRVACPEPVTVTVTGCVLLSGAGVPVGIPNESTPGETETEAGLSGGTANAICELMLGRKNVATKPTIKQTKLFRERMAHPLE